MKKSIVLLLSVILLIPAICLAAPKKKKAPSNADDRGLTAVSKSTGDGRRVALVIGNGAYKYTDSMPRLANPGNDADDIAAALRRFGFDVIAKKNLSKQQMDDAIIEFGRKAANGDAALFYFAGHGLQVKGQNYLVPVDAKIEAESQVPYNAINVNQLLDELDSSKSKINIVMLDACRNNPISGKFRSGATRGLAPPASSPKGTVIVYATDPGNVAADGSGRNGLFTAGLLTAFKSDDLSLFGVLTKASEVVEHGSNRSQTPYVNGPPTVQKNFSFAPGQSAPQQVAMAPRPQASPARVQASRSDNLTDPATGMEFLFVKGGCFQMGDTFGDGQEDEKPAHEVCVNDIYLGKHEVTKGQFNAFVQATGYRTEGEQGKGCFVWNGSKWNEDRSASWRSPGFFQDDSHPVVCVTHNDARAFADWVSGKLNRHVRLPTEAEWEYAARSGGKAQKYAGGFNLDAVGWYKDNSGMRTNPVGRKEANGLGLFDMTGNVWEWCSDWYDKAYYSNSPKDNPQGPSTGSYRVLRGGSWSDEATYARAADRRHDTPGDRRYDLGFRLASPVQ